MKPLVFVFCLFAMGCATTAQYEKNLGTWMGSDVNHLIEAWGVPAQTFTMPNGNKMFTYYFDGGSRTQFIYGSAFTTNYGCKTTFTSDSSNKVTNWAYEGNSCKSY